jgi:hypothetical protein
MNEHDFINWLTGFLDATGNKLDDIQGAIVRDKLKSIGAIVIPPFKDPILRDGTQYNPEDFIVKCTAGNVVDADTTNINPHFPSNTEGW